VKKFIPAARLAILRQACRKMPAFKRRITRSADGGKPSQSSPCAMDKQQQTKSEQVISSGQNVAIERPSTDAAMKGDSQALPHEQALGAGRTSPE
jgi:hypothetical protein